MTALEGSTRADYERAAAAILPIKHAFYRLNDDKHEILGAAVSSLFVRVRITLLLAGVIAAIRRCSMMRLILASLVLAISILPSYAQGTILHTDRSGYTTGIDGNRTVNTYTDRYGNTTGWIGGKYISTYSDGYGGTTGTIGNKRISTYEDGYGYTRGTIGRNQVNTYTEPSGFTTGTIGRRRVNCFTDRLRTTKCY